jgi:hypothetical protein
MNRMLVGLVIIGTFSGCASTPKMTYSYYPSKAVTTVSVSQSIICSVAKDALIVISVPIVTTSYAGDRSKALIKFDASQLRSGFADGDLTFTWYDDGRLKSVGHASTGQGEAVIKSAMTTVSSFGLPKLATARTNASTVCTKVPELNNGKAVALVYETTVNYTSFKPDELNEVPIKKGYQGLFSEFSGTKLPTISFRVSTLEENSPLVSENPPANNDAAQLRLRNTAKATVSVLESDKTIATATVTVPVDSEYTLPILKPAIFGKQVFGITLSEAGVPTVVTYNSTTGVGGALNALSAAGSTLSPNDATQAAALKAEADLIFQANRLAKCHAKPTTCQ